MKAIVAMTPERVIGYHGRIPWHIPEDFQWFKKQTMGHSLVMGRSTFESIGKPLPGRFTYILTEQKEKLALPKAEHCMYISYEELMRSMMANTWMACNAWVCGGARVYKTFLPVCDEVFATIVLDEYEGDTYMPEFEHLFLDSEILLETKKYWIVRYFNPDWAYKEIAPIPAGWRLLKENETTHTGDRFDSNGLWFPVEIRTPADFERQVRIIRYDRGTLS